MLVGFDSCGLRLKLQVVVRALVTQSKGDLAELWIQEVFKGEQIIFVLIIL